MSPGSPSTGVPIQTPAGTPESQPLPHPGGAGAARVGAAIPTNQLLIKQSRTPEILSPCSTLSHACSDLPEPSCHQRQGHHWSPMPPQINPPSTPACLGQGGRLNTWLQVLEEPACPTIPSPPSKAQHTHPQVGCSVLDLLNEVIYTTGFADTPGARSQGRPVAAIPLSVCLFIERYLCRITQPTETQLPCSHTPLANTSSYIHSFYGRMIN